ELTAEAAAPWSWGYYGMSSYGGNAGRRSVHSGDPPAYPRLTPDGIFSVDSSTRPAGRTGGTHYTPLLRRPYPRDPACEPPPPPSRVLSQAFSPRRLGEVGFRRQGHRAGHAQYPRADQLPGAARGRSPDGGGSVLRLRQRPPGRRQLRLRRRLRALPERPDAAAPAPGLEHAPRRGSGLGR